MIEYNIVDTDTKSPHRIHETFLPERSLPDVIFYKQDVPMGHSDKGRSRERKRKNLLRLGIDLIMPMHEQNKNGWMSSGAKPDNGNNNHVGTTEKTRL